MLPRPAETLQPRSAHGPAAGRTITRMYRPRRRLRARPLVTLLPLLLLALGAALPASGQPPHDDWRTLTLPRFRIHYPHASEAWARRVAARLEAVRERLAAEIGYGPTAVVDVVVADPLSRPNGLALPFLANPRMVLWTTPPEPSSVLGSHRDWGELVALHEDVHLVHLLRPSRNPWRRLLGRLIPVGGVGPIALRAPRWVSEGYATLLEGRLTSAGRPNSDLRAAILRQRALAGRLPGYGALGVGDRSWLGPEMAYLAGSAYLEWLETETAGRDALPDLWARMTARHDRSFDDAFRGVFGDAPAELYGRFVAEVTWRAMEAERRLAGNGGADEGGAPGELWLDLSWTTGAAAVSPDGSRLAAVRHHREEPPRLVVWETAVDEEAEERYRRERERIAAADPEDVPAVRTAPPSRKRVAELPTIDGRAPSDPRWTPDGEALLFAALAPGPDGFLRNDLYRWQVAAGELERLTRRADLRSPDPVPGSAWAVAVRNRHGLSQLVTVDLATGAVRALTEPSADEVWATPRVAPGGGRLAAVHHREGRWRLVAAELRPGAGGALELADLRELPTPEGATVADPAWAPDGDTLYAAVGGGGFLDLWAFDPTSAGEPAARRLTETMGAALAPEPTPDGDAIFFLALEHDGLDVRRLDLSEALAAGPREPLAGGLAPVILPARSAAPAASVELAASAEGELPPSRPYGAGPQDLTPLVGAALTSSGYAFEAGVRGGDLVGRLDWLLLGSSGDAGALEGGALTAAWRGWPVTVTAHLFATSELPTEQEPPSPVAGSTLDRDLTGVYLAGTWDRAFPGGGLAARLGGHWVREEVPPRGGRRPPSRETAAATASAAVAWAPSRGRRSLPMELALRLQEGSTAGDGWRRWSARGGLGLDLGDHALRLEYARQGSEDTPSHGHRFHVGGVRRSLLPDDVDFTRVPVPALPAGWLLGSEHEGQRVELELGLLPAPLFYERHRAWADEGRKGDWVSLAGIELQGALPPSPLLTLPGLRFTAGAAYVLEDPWEELDGDVRAWAAIAWRP